MIGSPRQRIASLVGVKPTHVRVGRVFAIVLAGAGLQVLTQTILARSLPKEEVGLFSLVLGALPLLSTLTLLGQDASIVRFLTRSAARSDESYAVGRHVRRVALAVVPLGAAIGLAGAGFYGLAGATAAAMIVLVASQNAVMIVTSVMRALHRYERAMLGRWLPLIAVAVLLSAMRIAGALTYERAVLALIVSFAASAVWLFLVRPGAGGAETGRPVPSHVVREGFFLLGLSLSMSVMVAMDKMIIGKLLPYSELAVYATVFAVMKGFDFLFYSVTYVLMPRVNTVERVPLRSLNLWIAAAAALVALIYLTVGDAVIHWLYAGRYDAGAYLILPFTLSGVLKLFYSVPSSIIIGRLPRPALRSFLLFNLAGIVVNVALDLALIVRMGILGAAIATAIAWGLRLGGGYAIMLGFRHFITSRAPDAE